MITFFPVFYIAALAIFAIILTVTDAVWGRIPNKVTIPFAILGLVFFLALWIVQIAEIAKPLPNSMSELALMEGGRFDVMFTYLCQITPFWSLVGFVVGFCILLIPFLLGGGGGGDVKLQATLGIWLGVKWFLLVFCMGVLLAAILGTCFFIAKGPAKMIRRMYNMKKFGSNEEPDEYTRKGKRRHSKGSRKERRKPSDIRYTHGVPLAIAFLMSTLIFLVMFAANIFQNVPVFYK